MFCRQPHSSVEAAPPFQRAASAKERWTPGSKREGDLLHIPVRFLTKPNALHPSASYMRHLSGDCREPDKTYSMDIKVPHFSFLMDLKEASLPGKGLQRPIPDVFGCSTPGLSFGCLIIFVIIFILRWLSFPSPLPTLGLEGFLHNSFARCSKMSMNREIEYNPWSCMGSKGGAGGQSRTPGLLF